MSDRSLAVWRNLAASLFLVTLAVQYLSSARADEDKPVLLVAKRALKDPLYSSTILLAKPIIGALAPLRGVEIATLAYVLAIVYAIVAFGEMVPMFFNNYAFMYLTVTGLAMHLPQPNPYLWMAIAGIGGGVLIAGVVGIGKLMARSASAP